MKGSATEDTVAYGRLDCRLDHPAAIDHHNRKYDGEAFELDRVGRDATDRFSWSKPKLTEFRQWRTNPLPRPLSKVATSELVDQLRSMAALERFERALDRVAGRVSDEEAANVADALIGPPVDSPTFRAYCLCGCGRLRDPVHVAGEMVRGGVAPRDAVENITAHYGLTEAEQEWVLVQVEDELDGMVRR